MSDEVFDYVIVGAGSAGCVLADRLTEDGRSTVLVLEYGGSDRSVFIQMPAALSIPMNMKAYNWGYVSEPEPHLDGRRMPVRAARFSAARPRSTASSMCAAIRSTSSAGKRRARRAGGTGTCCPTSAAQRAFAAAPTPGAATAGRSRPRMAASCNPLYAAFIEAGREAGYAVSPDLNGERQEGFGPLDMTVRDGVRASTANAYLRPAMKTPQPQGRHPRARDPDRLRRAARRRRRITGAKDASSRPARGAKSFFAAGRSIRRNS